MSVSLSKIVLWAVVISLGLWLLRWLWGLLSLAVPLALAGIVALFILDTLSGGTALQQIIDRITTWLKRHGIGG